MSIRLHASADLAEIARAHLDRPGERVGFFLADTTPTTFTLSEWRPIADAQLLPGRHAVLTDEAVTEIIRWAFTAEAALVEVHSHGPFAPARFSPIDTDGFTDWVPGVRWRLRGRPYAAAVIAAGTIDAWAWIDRSGQPQQVDALVIDNTHIVPTTRATLEDHHDRQ